MALHNSVRDWARCIAPLVERYGGIEAGFEDLGLVTAKFTAYPSSKHAEADALYDLGTFSFPDDQAPFKVARRIQEEVILGAPFVVEVS